MLISKRILARVLPSVLCLGLLASGVAQSNQTFSAANEPLSSGQALLMQGRIAEAEVELEKARSLSPNDCQLLMLLAKVKGRLGKSQEAIALFQRVAELRPKSAEAHLDLAIVYSDAGMLAQGLEETSKALALDPHLAPAQLNRARILDDLHREQEARAEFTTACRLLPNDSDCFFYWSFVERALSDFAKETIVLQRAVRLQPERTKAWVMLGRSLLAQARKQEAVAALRQALVLDPDSSEATYMLSRALAGSDPQEAKQMSEQFLALRQKNAALEHSKALGNQAYGAYTQQDWPTAIRLYKGALDSCGECEIQADLHKNLGLTLCHAGNVEEGASELHKALALNPNDSDVVKALAVLEQH
ncbi:MAG TPA: tetratricopeptide repeat protein [Terracidiphilus sp.]|jgi:tetratricopeptide (TPR) repeat protein|nr:tetratricopeptide repeat protein [Terracidiphilus sp.]